ncbi:alpha/beta fold hydrolase [Portibacter marinus]|uniref:alpha/beta fold hydrolase n=1 Tax=Portibacter marinus TaxID=2898660 RepID=UPI001F159CFA|nr:alpha/beta hydrolase [Portibacter marinus]
MIIKIFAAIILLLIILAGIAYLYVDRVGQGSQEGSLPDGYRLIEANGFEFSTKISGDENDIPVILLHGFPESSIIYKRLMADLNKEGYYTIAPDQRGYSFKARPHETDQYHISYLAEDVMAIADALNLDTFHLIGHDWGSGVGWVVAAHHPERLHSFTSLSVPHLAAFSRAYQEDSLQYKASDYIRNFQTKKMPEFMMARNDFKMLKTIWSEHSEEEVEAYVNILSQKKALTSAINWYRANYNGFVKGFDKDMIDIPTLFIWGKNDKALSRSGVEWTEDYVTDYYKFVELDAGHWLLQEAYDEVKAEILLHLKKF